jgi:hypothetical protein
MHLYEKVYRKDVLAFAYECCQANGRAARSGRPDVRGHRGIRQERCCWFARDQVTMANSPQTSAQVLQIAQIATCYEFRELWGPFSLSYPELDARHENLII